MTSFTSKVLLISSLSLVPTMLAVNTAQANPASCTKNQCKVQIPVGYNCLYAAVTNAGYTWRVRLSYRKDGKNVIGIFSGRGESDSPMKWIKGTAVFNAKQDHIWLTHTANGSTNVKMRSGGGTVRGASGSLITGEDGVDRDFNDIVSTLSCLQVGKITY